MPVLVLVLHPSAKNLNLRSLANALPARERELLSHVADCCMTKEAASRMGISRTNALTYRYRTFQRLGI